MATPIEPVVQLFNTADDVEVTDLTPLNFGEVKAGDASTTFKLRLWNNKGGITDASTMQDVELMVLDASGAKIDRLVTDGWIHAKCTTADVPAEVTLDDTNSLLITATGQEAAGEGKILGTINTGIESDTGNFADIDVYAQIKKNMLDVPHGKKDFSLAFRYFFT